MNARQARAYVLRCLAAEARHHSANGSEWLEVPLREDGIATSDEGRFSEADQTRVTRALHEIADELEAKSIRLRATEVERKIKKLRKAART